MRAHTSHARAQRLVLAMTAVVLPGVLVAGCSSSGSGGSATSAPATTTPAAAATTPAATPAAASSTPASTGSLTGKWTGSYGGTFTGTFTLTWVESSGKLTGTIDLSTSGTVPLNGTVEGDQITFGTVGSTAVTYTGSVSGDTMSGTYKAGTAGSGTWQAHRTA
jgi:hypothetical protein